METSSATILITDRLFVIFQTKHSLVPAPQMCGFAAFLCYKSYLHEYLWECWTKKLFAYVTLDAMMDILNNFSYTKLLEKAIIRLINN